MSESHDLPAVDRITVGAVGPPGQRLFLLQARQGPEVVTLKVEKVQVAALSQSLAKLLSDLGRSEGAAESLDLEEPAEPEWVVGTLGVGYDEDSDRILLIAEELTPEDEDDVLAGGARFRAPPPCTSPTGASVPSGTSPTASTNARQPPTSCRWRWDGTWCPRPWSGPTGPWAPVRCNASCPPTSPSTTSPCSSRGDTTRPCAPSPLST